MTTIKRNFTQHAPQAAARSFTKKMDETISSYVDKSLEVEVFSL